MDKRDSILVSQTTHKNDHKDYDFVTLPRLIYLMEIAALSLFSTISSESIQG